MWRVHDLAFQALSRNGGIAAAKSSCRSLSSTAMAEAHMHVLLLLLRVRWVRDRCRSHSALGSLGPPPYVLYVPWSYSVHERPLVFLVIAAAACTGLGSVGSGKEKAEWSCRPFVVVEEPRWGWTGLCKMPGMESIAQGYGSAWR